MNATVKAGILGMIFFTIIILGYFLFVHDRVGKAPLTGGKRTELTEPGPGKGAGESQPQVAGKPVTELIPRGEVVLTVEVLEKGSRRQLQGSWLTVDHASDGDRRGQKVWDSRSERAAGGRFEKALEPGAYVVYAQCSRYKGEKREVTIIKDTPQKVVFELDRGDSISGRILDSSGAGIAGARVMALKELGSPDSSLEELLINMVTLPERTDHIDAETVSGDDGSYQLDGLELAWYTVRAVASNHAPNEVGDVPAPREKVDITLQSGGNVGGSVRDAGGAPIEGAEIKAYTALETQNIFAIIVSKSRPPVDSARTDASGYYRFETLGAGLFNFLVSAPRHQTSAVTKVPVGPRKEDLNFTLTPGQVITGVVRGPNGEPVSGARVRAQLSGGAAAGAPPEPVKIDFDDGGVSSDVQGQFVFDTLKEGEYTLLCWHQDYQTARRQGVRPGKEEVELKLDHGGRIQGLVTDPSGQPVAGAKLSASDVADIRKDAVSGEDGRFVLTGLTGGQRSLTVTVTAKGHARARREVRVNGNVEVEENFELQPTGRISGLVVNSNSDPISGARIMVKKGQENNAGVEQTVGNAITDRQGRFEVEDVEAGERLYLAVKKSEYLDERSDAFGMEPSQSVEVPTLTLKLGGAVVGKVVGAGGQPVTNGMVTVYFEGDTPLEAAGNPSSPTNARGEFRIQGLAAGMVDLEVKAPHYLDKVISGVQIQEGKENREYATSVIQLEQGNGIAGHVTNQRGEPVANAEVIVRDLEQGAKELRAVSGADGRFRVESILSQKTVDLQVTHPDYSGYFNEKAPVGSSEFEVVLRELGRFTGRVVTEGGAAVDSFSVHPQNVGGKKDPRKQLKPQTFTSQDGTFEYTGVQAGSYNVVVNAPGHAAATLENVSVGDGQVVDLGEVLLGAGGIVSGQVLDADTRAPISGARVQVVQGTSRFLRDTDPNSVSGAEAPKTFQETDANGTFTLSGLKGGNLSLRVTEQGYIAEKVDEINPDLAGSARNLQIFLSRGGEITGRVLDSSGNARSSMPIYLIGDSPNTNQSSNTDREGRFRFSAVPAGIFTVKAHQFGGKPNNAKREQGEVRVELGAGQSQDVLIQLSQ